MSAEREGGFDAVIGNPPWDRMKMQEVEWFAARAPEVAREPLAADRKARITQMKEAGDPLISQFEIAASLAEMAIRCARNSGDYPLLARGDINIYSLFVERAQALIKGNGISGLLTPPGVAFDRTASAFFQSVAIAGRLHALYVFENEGRWLFKHVHSEERPTISVISGPDRITRKLPVCFHVTAMSELSDKQRHFELPIEALWNCNPNTKTAVLFRYLKDVTLINGIYSNSSIMLPRVVDIPPPSLSLESGPTFHMTTESRKFWIKERLERAGAYSGALATWQKGEKKWLPLLEGKAIEQFNHRYARVEFGGRGFSGQGQEVPSSLLELKDPNFRPLPRYWVSNDDMKAFPECGWTAVFRDTANINNERTCFSAIVPHVALANTLNHAWLSKDRAIQGSILVSGINSFVIDYVARNKIQARHLNWFIAEQLPVLRKNFDSRMFGRRSAGDLIRSHVLSLTYTSNDMALFARDMGYVDDAGAVKPPIVWDEVERRQFRARLDALHFILYGVTKEDDIRYVLSTFPIVERKDRQEFDGVFLTEELILWYKRALDAGDPDSLAPEAELVRLAKSRMN